MQLWPAKEKALAAIFEAAPSTSASASTMTGVALPSSRLTRLRAARSRSFQPTGPEPVKVISLTRSSSTKTSPISADGPTRTLSQPGGSPASVSSSASRSAESGVCDAGFSTTAQPAARAGAILCATRLSGKLKGEIAATTPIGNRIVNASLPSPACEASIGTISPASVRACAAAIVYVDIARATSTRAAFIGLPASAEIRPAASSARRPSAPATRTRISARLCAGNGSAIARSAASIAALVSSVAAFATRATSDPSYGARTSTHSPVSTHSPSISSARSVAVVAMAQGYAAACAAVPGLADGEAALDVGADLGGDVHERARGRRAVPVAVPDDPDRARRDRGLQPEHPHAVVAPLDGEERPQRRAVASGDKPLHRAVVVRAERELDLESLRRQLLLQPHAARARLGPDQREVVDVHQRCGLAAGELVVGREDEHPRIFEQRLGGERALGEGRAAER